MKKYVVALLSVLVVLAFAVTSFALHQSPTTEYTPSLVKAKKASIELGGELRVRGNVTKDADFDSSNTNETSQYYDQRARLSLKANTSANTFGFIELESGEDVSTTSNSKDTVVWGNSSNTKTGALSIRQAYIAHQGKGLGMLTGIKAGHLLAALGNNLFFDHSKFGDDGIVLWAAVGDGEVSLTTLKLDENDTPENDDTDAYILGFEMPVAGISVGGDLTNLRTRDKDTHDNGQRFYNLGLRADADLKVVKVKVDVEKQFGKKGRDAAGDEEKSSGAAFMLGAEAPLGPVTARAKAAYGSGDETSDTKDKSFNTFLSDQQNYTFIYEYTVPAASRAKNTGLENTMFFNVGVTAKPMDALKVSADAYLLRAVKAVNLNSALNADGTDATSKSLGFEIDAKAEYEIDTNLAYFVEAGMLFAGEAYDLGTATAGTNTASDNPYRVRHGVILKF
ncbi:MAG: alginate export family protein [Nitrospirae bacterium]|nr:alginate export family protein [Nitrospirota bacterium]